MFRAQPRGLYPIAALSHFCGRIQPATRLTAGRKALLCNGLQESRRFFSAVASMRQNPARDTRRVKSVHPHLVQTDRRLCGGGWGRIPLRGLLGCHGADY